MFLSLDLSLIGPIYRTISWQDIGATGKAGGDIGTSE
jgi:hypothetical protein